jgi:hypothetical protein
MTKKGIAAVFFIFFFLFLLLYINPRIIHTCNGASIAAWVRFSHAQANAAGITQKAGSYHFPKLILETTPAYFKQAVFPPGGVTRFVITILMEACAYPVAGALLITICAWLLFAIPPLFSRQCGGSPLLISRYLLPLWLLAACAGYELNVLFWMIPLLGAFTAASLYQRLKQRGVVVNAAAMTVLFWVVWYLCGPACILFLILALLHNLFSAPRSLAINMPTAALSAAIIYIVEYLFVPPEYAMDFGFLLSPPMAPVFAIVGISAIIVFFHPATVRFLLRGHANKLLSRKIPEWARATLVLLLAALTIALIAAAPLNRDTRTVARTLHFLLEKQWNRILSEDFTALYRNFPRENSGLQTFAAHAVCRAQYERGQLGSALFSRPLSQFSAEPLMLLDATLVSGFANWIAALDLYAELGLVNLAEKVTGETMECMGPYDFLVYRRVQLQAAKGNCTAAAVYCRKLAGMPLFRRKALSFLEKLNDSAALAADSHVAHLRQCMDTVDYFLYQSREETMLRSILKSNPKNRMAYEYLIAFYLLTGEPGKASSEISRAADLGYDTLPCHWQEALCLAMSQDSSWAAQAPELPVRPETMERFDRFMQRYSLLENDPAAAPRKLEDEFGDSYFFFYTFEFTRNTRGFRR